MVKAALQVENKETKTETETETIDMNKSAKNQDLFQDNKAIKVKYTTTKIKSRNFLSNVAHVAINKEDSYNNNFIFDVYLLVTKNLNLYSLDRNWLTKQSTK